MRLRFIQNDNYLTDIFIMKPFNLYVIINIEPNPKHSPAEFAQSIISGGADIIQLRCKGKNTAVFLEQARIIRQITASAGIPLIINDRLDIAQAVGADGVHLGQDDLPIDAARYILGKDCIIGISTHSIQQALTAQSGGADYIAMGPVFHTNSKPDVCAPVGLELIKQYNEKIHIPWLAIGGINRHNLPGLVDSGIRRIAVISAIADADDVTSAARELKQMLSKPHLLSPLGSSNTVELR